MEYSIIDVKAGLLFEACLDAAIHRYDGWHSEDIYGNIYQDSFVKIDPIPWGADQAYQLLQGGTSEYSSSYILCYGSRIVELNPDWDLTEAQMGVVGKILGE